MKLVFFLKRIKAVVVCSVLFCCIVPSAQSELKVYDADNQYLGIAIQFVATSTVVIFIPSIEAFTRLASNGDLFSYGTVVYESSD